ncbi:ABC transporter ATP-binding protein [uncultured Mucilaginibacter sp.]|uniref:ABC transporter ATP-binding protein n=1 Tax=uncultured Mucilaginibacter sp. TaxID=797541 RepID=UPI0026118F0A|nr:ABC transporter ATP-binding protein [uncultured Mucilaginibacter sp.]
MQNPYFSLLATAWRYAKNDRKIYLLTYALFIGANLVAALNPFFYGWFVNSIQKNGLHTISSVWLYALGFLALRLTEWAFHGPARVQERKLAFKISQNYLDELYQQLVHLPIGWHKDHHSGSTINRLRKAYAALRDFFQSGFLYMQSLLKFVISFSVMFYFSPLFGAIAIVLGFATFWVILKFDKPFIASLKEVNEAEHKVSSNLFDSLSNIVTVITLRLEKRVHTGLMEKLQAVFPPFKKNVVINEWKWFTAQMLVALIYVVMVVGYVYQHNQPGKVFMLGGLVTLLGFVNQFTSVFNDFAQQYTQIVQFHTDVETAKVIESAFEKEHRALNESRLPQDWQNLTIRNLNYNHPKKGNEPTNVNAQGILSPIPGWKKSYGLKGMNLDIHRGQRIALIGESGCGKSTLLALLRGLYEPTIHSTLAVDGDNRKNFSDIGNSVTLFPQEPEIFEATFEYNITLGLPFENEEVKRVSEITRLSPVLENLEDGVNAMIQEKGVNLSGGQKQRLALARGVLAAQTSSIILLDEPTSSMDPKTEQEIYMNLFNEFQGKTVISTLHRLHLLQHFDYIYVLDKGRIAEEGSLEFLLEHGEMFNKLWSHQQKQATDISLN